MSISTKRGEKTVDFSHTSIKVKNRLKKIGNGIKSGASKVRHASKVGLTTVLEDVSDGINNLKSKVKPEDYDELQQKKANKLEKRKEVERAMAKLKELKQGL